MATKKAAAKPLEGTGGAAKARAKPKKEAAKTDAQAAQEAATQAPAPIKLTLAIDAPAAAVDKLISSIKGRGVKLDADMHSAACASLNHVALHNDPTLLNRLILAFPKSARRNSLVAWAMKHGNVMQNDDRKTNALMPVVYDRSKRPNIDAAIAEPFYALKNVREGGAAWVYMDYIGNVIKTLERQASTDGTEGRRAKAALDAIKAVNEAVDITPDNMFVPGQTPERRAVH